MKNERESAPGPSTGGSLRPPGGSTDDNGSDTEIGQGAESDGPGAEDATLISDATLSMAAEAGLGGYLPMSRQQTVLPLLDDDDIARIWPEDGTRAWLNDGIINTYLQLVVSCSMDMGTLDSTLFNWIKSFVGNTQAIRASIVTRQTKRVVLCVNMQNEH